MKGEGESDVCNRVPGPSLNLEQPFPHYTPTSKLAKEEFPNPVFFPLPKGPFRKRNSQGLEQRYVGSSVSTITGGAAEADAFQHCKVVRIFFSSKLFQKLFPKVVRPKPDQKDRPMTVFYLHTLAHQIIITTLKLIDTNREIFQFGAWWLKG